MKMKSGEEKNWKEALPLLPQYKAPDEIWEHIDKRLDDAAEDEYLRRAMEALPTYSPPPVLWGEIARKLNRQISPTLRWAHRVAAVWLILVMATTVAILFSKRSPFYDGKEEDLMKNETTLPKGLEAIRGEYPAEDSEKVYIMRTLDTLRGSENKEIQRLLNEWQELRSLSAGEWREDTRGLLPARRDSLIQIYKELQGNVNP